MSDQRVVETGVDFQDNIATDEFEIPEDYQPAPIEEPAPYVPPEPVLSPEEIMEENKKKLSLMFQIQAYYRSSFAKLIQPHLSPTELESRSVDDLRLLLDSIKFNISISNTQTLGANMYFGAVQTVEFVGCKAGMKIGGLSAVLQANESYRKCVEEVMLDMNEAVYVKPIYRLGFMTMSTALALHNQNTAKEELSKHATKPVSKDIADKHKDL